MTAAPPGPDLAIDALTHRFDRVTALEDVSLAIGAGQILALLGPSGCGKSTLLRLVAGLEAIQHGRIAIGGRTVGAAPGPDLPPEQRNVGFLFQDYALFPHLSAADNIGFGLQHLGAAERRNRVGEVLERVGVSALADAYPHTLSGGQQQRIALARALAPAPGMLLLDEPLSGLDARLRHGLADTLLAVLRETGTTAVVVTHDPEEAMYVADRIGVMRDGRLMQFGPPGAVYGRPESPFVANFLSDTNRLSGTVGGAGAIDTGWGPVDAGDLPAGAAVQILVRYEGVGFAGDGAVRARVLRSRPIGGDALIALETTGRPGETLYARAPAARAPHEGDCVAVTLDPAHVFVFPSANAK
ncbi:MAG: ABC transporter ATP-binding protein [Rhodospirillaceae bacterium]|nr:ABC transporter ATP-binding protein [Rhodospirillaceae bacterium]